uniref:Ig-like domain-containing protein n=1 Tax=Pygocentrus nattereri TaxID=42514 RepID=A0A3B4D0W3_PYGNA
MPSFSPLVSAKPQINISAKVGSLVLLPCDFSSKLSSIQKPHIEWSISSETVFERGGNESFQGYSYEDRVDVPEDKLSHGNGSLVLKDVRHADERIYKCKLKMKTGRQNKWVFIQAVSLSVEGKDVMLRGTDIRSSVYVGLYCYGLSCTENCYTNSSKCVECEQYSNVTFIFFVQNFQLPQNQLRRVSI